MYAAQDTCGKTTYPVHLRCVACKITLWGLQCAEYLGITLNVLRWSAACVSDWEMYHMPTTTSIYNSHIAAQFMWGSLRLAHITVYAEIFASENFTNGSYFLLREKFRWFLISPIVWVTLLEVAKFSLREKFCQWHALAKFSAWRKFLRIWYFNLVQIRIAHTITYPHLLRLYLNIIDETLSFGSDGTSCNECSS